MREKAANPPAARPTLLCSVPCRYTALQSATVPSPKSAQKAMKPSRSKSPEGLKMARPLPLLGEGDRKSTRLNSSHPSISYAVFCLKKKKHLLSLFSSQKNNTKQQPI